MANEGSTLVDEAVGWASVNGFLMGAGEEGQQFTHVPFSLYPTPIPKLSFDQAVEVAPLFNSLVDAISRDSEWIIDTLEGVIAGDEFTARLLQIYKSVLAEGISQPLALGLHRNDFMLHQPEEESALSGRMLQVEFNTIASSFGCLSTQLTEMHRFLLSRYPDLVTQAMASAGVDVQALTATAAAAAAGESKDGSGSGGLASLLPPNDATAGLASGIAAAHAAVGDDSACVLFVVQPGEQNSVDQRWLEYALWSHHSLPVRRASLLEVSQRGSLAAADGGGGGNGSGGLLCLDGQRFSVVYFRAGYTPRDYPSEAEWEARLLIERSTAVKCPNIAYHLTGTKKIQQVLAVPGTLRRFLPDDASADACARHFAGLWALGEGVSEADAEARGRALASPGGYVVKPQREGGGNNYYGDDVATVLSTMDPEELSSHILMQRIFPRLQPSVLVRNGKGATAACLSEFGVFAVFLGDGTKTHLNRYAGYLVRSKMSGVDEGGVATGFSVLNSALLVPEEATLDTTSAGGE